MLNLLFSLCMIIELLLTPNSSQLNASPYPQLEPAGSREDSHLLLEEKSAGTNELAPQADASELGLHHFNYDSNQESGEEPSIEGRPVSPTAESDPSELVMMEPYAQIYLALHISDIAECHRRLSQLPAFESSIWYNRNAGHHLEQLHHLLNLAYERNQLEFIDLLLSKDLPFVGLFFWVVRNGLGRSQVLLEHLFRRYPQKITTAMRNMTLIEACASGDLATVSLLLQYGADPNYLDESGNTALTLSIASLDVLKLFVAEGSLLAPRSVARAIALSIASLKDFQDVAARGDHRNHPERDPEDQWEDYPQPESRASLATLRRRELVSSRLEAIKILLTACPQAADMGHTRQNLLAITMSAFRSEPGVCYDIAKFLLQAGVDVNATGSGFSSTPLMMLMERWRLPLITVVRAGNESCSPLIMLRKMVKLLVKQGALLDYRYAEECFSTQMSIESNALPLIVAIADPELLDIALLARRPPSTHAVECAIRLILESKRNAWSLPVLIRYLEPRDRSLNQEMQDFFGSEVNITTMQMEAMLEKVLHRGRQSTIITFYEHSRRYRQNLIRRAIDESSSAGAPPMPEPILALIEHYH